jgi:hypothetical protein
LLLENLVIVEKKKTLFGKVVGFAWFEEIFSKYFSAFLL